MKDKAKLVVWPEYLEQLTQMAQEHPDWHIRTGQELRWGYPQDKNRMRTPEKELNGNS